MHRRQAVGVKFLNKYTNKQKLGKGAFGDVYLVEDDSGRLSALKMIDKKKIQAEHQDMLDYLHDQIKCMNHVKDSTLVELYSFQKDDDYYYMFMQYCDQGDLVKCQAKYSNRVFPMQTAVQYLSQVIIGLQKLHKQGYLHRDIKPQNILIKNVNGKKTVKIADFGFAKKASNAHGTICGTQNFMSPEIYECGIEGIDGVNGQDYYGYEVDMWAFGVLFYAMLNRQYPFVIHPYWNLQQKYQQLKNQAKNFSYKETVQKSKLKLLSNCSNQLEDLFKKIFHIDPQKRIKFNQIRIHPIFRKYFPKASEESQILYMNKFKSAFLKSGKISTVTNNLNDKLISLKKKKTLNIAEISNPQKQIVLTTEKHIVDLELEEIQFIWHFMENINDLKDILETQVTLMVSYNLVTYYLYLLTKFDTSFKSSIYNKKHSKIGNLQWKALFDHSTFHEFQKQYAKRINKAYQKSKDLSTKCQNVLSEIMRINPHFKILQPNFVNQQIQLDERFYLSYRQSTNIIYGKIKIKLKASVQKKLFYNLCVSCICHIFDEIINDQDQKQQLFSVYLKQEKQKGPIFSYDKFEKYLKASSISQMIQLAQKVIRYFLDV